MNVGDLVTIVDPGNIYSTYSMWVEENCTREELNAWTSNHYEFACEGGIYRVIHIAPHGINGDTLHFIYDVVHHKYRLIGERGIMLLVNVNDSDYALQSAMPILSQFAD